MRRGCFFGWMAALLMVAVPGLAQEAGKAPLDRMQGTWNYTWPDGSKGTWVVSGPDMKVTLPTGEVYESKAILPETAGAIDFQINAGPDDAVGLVVKGLYAFEGDSLKIGVAAPGEPRPGSFEGDDPAAFQFTLTRAENPEARDLARMAGTWTLDLPEGQATLTFKADKLDVKAPNRTYSVTLTLDPEAIPHPAVDFHVDEGPDDARGQTNQAIYKFEGEELTLCVDGGAGERPTSFRTAEGTSYEFRLKRKP